MKEEAKNYLLHGKFCSVEYSQFPDSPNQGEEVQKYFDDHYMKIVEILAPIYDYHRTVSIRFVEEKGKCAYGRGKIDINPSQLKIGNWGCLIHEATHAVQNYPEGIGEQHLYWPWMEGIADYCRYMLDREFAIKKGDPLRGYRATAHFLVWLVKQYDQRIIQVLNNFIHNNSERMPPPDFFKNFKDLLSDYQKTE